jgi:hypothetical protein
VISVLLVVVKPAGPTTTNSTDRGIPNIAHCLSSGLGLPSIQTQHSNTSSNPPNPPPLLTPRLRTVCQSTHVLHAQIIIDVLTRTVVSRLWYGVRPGGCLQQRVIKTKTSAQSPSYFSQYFYCGRIFQYICRCCYSNAGNEEMEHNMYRIT